MSKLHQSTKGGFKQISDEDLRNYNEYRAQQYADQKSAKTFWAFMGFVGLFGGAILELSYPTGDAILAKIGVGTMIVSRVMIMIASANRD